jgi:hypothetical protein
MTLQSIPGVPQQNVPIPERGTYVPSWCPWLANKDADLNIPVKHEGEPLGFTVAQVLPERRWAVQLDGELLDQREFAEEIQRWYIPMLPEGGEARYEPIPRVERFVSMTWEGPDRGYMEIGFDPDKAPPEKLKPQYNQEGEISRHVIEERNQAKEKQAKLEQLAELLAEGVITEAQFAEKSKAMLLDKEGKPEPVLEAVSEAEPVAEPEPEFEVALCGKDVKAGYLKQHMGRCKDCKILSEG